MFGTFAHGILLLGFSLFLLWKEKERTPLSNQLNEVSSCGEPTWVEGGSTGRIAH